jgi:serine/threonine protein kinase
MPPLPEVSPYLLDFLKLCFIKNPKHRPSAKWLFDHPWLQSLDVDLILRNQDSLPFLRRMSMHTKPDFQRHSTINSDTLAVERRPSSPFSDIIHDTPGKSRWSISAGSSSRRETSDETEQEHTFVKTSFGKSELNKAS